VLKRGIVRFPNKHSLKVTVNDPMSKSNQFQNGNAESYNGKVTQYDNLKKHDTVMSTTGIPIEALDSKGRVPTSSICNGYVEGFPVRSQLLFDYFRAVQLSQFAVGS
jgi:hypothetical protein